MAARTTPSKGGKPDKLFRDALMIAVNREDNVDGKKIKRIMRLASKLVDVGLEGDTSALKEIRDTLDGKPAQSIGLGQAPDLEPVAIAERPMMTREQWLALHSFDSDKNGI